MSSRKLTAGKPFPEMMVAKFGCGELKLGLPSSSNHWQLIFVYRGKHCPICTDYLKMLNEVLPELEKLKVEVFAVSADPEEKAQVQLALVHPKFEVGYNLTVEQMQSLGLYISHPRSPT